MKFMKMTLLATNRSKLICEKYMVDTVLMRKFDGQILDINMIGHHVHILLKI